ncbi:MAG: PEGA domain-containing protein [Spirochaetales bacterium]|nr:PEGA domain-containing protein [Spirochaetales bacterium]
MKKKMLLVFLGLSLVCTASVFAQVRRERHELNPRHITITVNSNVAGDVFLDGKRVGRTGEAIVVKPGKYSVTVRADGYTEFSTSVFVKKSMFVDARLQPLFSEIRLDIPRRYLSEARNPMSLILFIVDGVPQHGHSARVKPGRHEIGIGSGGLVFTKSVDIRAGRDYTITPDFDIRVQ